MKYYAVRKGRVPGIYKTWAECQENIKGYSGAVFKSFLSEEQAADYMAEQEEQIEIDPGLPFAYIDGSFNQESKTYGYGGFLINAGKRYILQGTGTNEDYTEYRNITGEIRGALEVIKTATELNISELNLFYDYAGIEQWACGSWACKNKLTQFYKAYYDKHNVKINFFHTKGHNGIEGNELADLLAKEAVKVKMTKKAAALLEEFKSNPGYLLTATIEK